MIYFMRLRESRHSSPPKLGGAQGRYAGHDGNVTSALSSIPPRPTATPPNLGGDWLTTVDKGLPLTHSANSRQAWEETGSG